MNGERYRKIWIFTAVSLLIILVASELVAFALLPKSSDLSVENDGKEGLSIVYGSIPEGITRSVLLTSPTLLLEEDDPSNTLFISIGPQRDYTLTEVHAIEKFYSKGGRVLLADDTGRMNSLSGRFDITIINGQLYDETFQDHPDLVKIDDVDLEFFTGFLLLNKPSSLIFTGGKGLVRSSASSWVDRNGNGVMDNLTSSQGEAPGPRYIAAMTDPNFKTAGSGNTVIISDPSMFMNNMIREADNLDFFLALVNLLLPDGGKVIFDEGVHSTPGTKGIIQRASRASVFLVTDINLKIVTGTMVAITFFALAYIHDPPGRQRHVTILDRTGVAEIVDPGVGKGDQVELRKILLDRVRVHHGMSTEFFSNLEWEEVEKLIGKDPLYRFARYDELPKGMDLNNILVEVSTWERK
jgi:hypothetical protein